MCVLLRGFPIFDTALDIRRLWAFNRLPCRHYDSRLTVGLTAPDQGTGWEGFALLPQGQPMGADVKARDHYLPALPLQSCSCPQTDALFRCWAIDNPWNPTAAGAL